MRDKRMNLNLLVAVSAYAGDYDQVEAFLPVYLHHGAKVVILSPEDKPILSVSNPDVLCLTAGEACWAGPKAIARQIKFLEVLSAFPHEYFLFNDADSFCLAPNLPGYIREDVVWSNEVVDTNPGPSYLPKLAMQPPYFFSKRALKAMLAVKNNLPTSYYGESKTPEGWPMPVPTDCPDHLMLQLSHACGHKSFFHGASFETVSPRGLEIMAELVREHGRIFIHSVKSKAVFGRLMHERKECLRTHPEFR